MRSDAMRRHLAPLLTASLSLLVACGSEDEPSAPARAEPTPAKAAETVAFPLEQENRSGSSGRATLEGGDRGFTVKLVVKPPKNSGPAHIHGVTCEKYRAMKDFDAQYATIEVGLSDLVDGKAETRIDAALSKYRTGGFSINVQSYAGGFPVVACGNIPGA